MSQQLISRNADLKRLRDEGYSVSVVGNHLVVDRVPYVSGPGKVACGALVSDLTLHGDKTAAPTNHVVHFVGDYPCNKNGQPLEKIRNQSKRQDLGNGLVINHSFSSKPPQGYGDYFEKMSTYAAILAGPAASIDPESTATPFLVVENEDEDCPFRYPDSASGRVGITDINERVANDRIGIIGLGGTGSYVLDLVAKTPVREIHLFDDDDFYSHNAFRSPGAASIDELRLAQTKVALLKRQYEAIRSHIIPHEVRIGPSNLELLDTLTYVFLCIDDGKAKSPIIERLEALNIPFVDSGLGVNRDGGKLLGVLRVTSSTPDYRSHIHEKQRIPLGPTLQDEYSTNIQIAELNALCATLSVIKWKKHRGIYLDLEDEHYTTYTIDGNEMTNEDKGEQQTSLDA